jgi:hypothetical protein
MSPFCQRLTFARDASDGLDHRLARVRRRDCALEPAADAEPRDGQRLLHALAQRRRRPGVRVSELAGERAQLVERAVVVVERPRGAQAAAHE